MRCTRNIHAKSRNFEILYEFRGKKVQYGKLQDSFPKNSRRITKLYFLSKSMHFVFQRSWPNIYAQYDHPNQGQLLAKTGEA